ncbi:hypothetical protein A7C99_2690 [Trichophyton rubrum]|uniref:Uncharacterized protein n=1 Tax=Trichophyton rubrum TaxID=5551 RepID=A0A178F1P7_TRIRU|nr:hypothetical protein A7C99_2690 [Trichophyton rubrum]
MLYDSPPLRLRLQLDSTSLRLLLHQTIGDPTRLAACLISIAAANGIGGYPRAHNHEWRRVFALVHLLFILTPGTAVHWMDHRLGQVVAG